MAEARNRGGRDRRRKKKTRSHRWSRRRRGFDTPSDIPPEPLAPLPGPPPPEPLTLSRALVASSHEDAARVALTCKHLGIEVHAVRGDALEAAAYEDSCDALIEIPAANGHPDPEALVRAAVEMKAGIVHPGWAGPHQLALARAMASSGIPFAGSPADALERVGDRDQVIAAAAAAGMRLMEEPLFRPRIIDVGILADAFGDVAAVGERERSIVDAGRSVLLESPSPLLIGRGDGEAIRVALFEAAGRLFKQLGALGLGTVTFHIDADNVVYFDDVVLGLDPAHVLFEMVSGLDLVELELRVAAGQRLPEGLADQESSGHAFLARVLGRRPDGDGEVRIEEIRWPPTGTGKLHVDAMVRAGAPFASAAEETVLRVAACAPVRHQALLTLDRVLASTVVTPLLTNVERLRSVLAQESFRFGQYDTEFLERLEPAKP